VTTPTGSTRSPVEVAPRHRDRAAALLRAFGDRDRLDPAEPTLGQRIARALALAEAEGRALAGEQQRTDTLREVLDLVADMLPDDDDPPGRPL
jgi:hypothetical protein